MSHLDPQLLRAASKGKSSFDVSRPETARLLKVIVVGSPNVGKTSLMKRYVKDEFTGARKPTIGADFMSKELTISDENIVLQIWDTAGQERFHTNSLGSSFYRGASAAIIVYDVTSLESLQQVISWHEEISDRLTDEDRENFPIVIVANKVDLLKNRKELEEKVMDISKWCAMKSVGHLETSAKEGVGVEAAMVCVSMLALEEKKRRSVSSRRSSEMYKVTSNQGALLEESFCC